MDNTSGSFIRGNRLNRFLNHINQSSKATKLNTDYCKLDVKVKQAKKVPIST